MKDIDLEKYKLAWKDEKGFNRKTLSDEQIRKYLTGRSQGMTGSFKAGIIIDIVLKITLGISFIYLILLYSGYPWILIFCAVSILTIVCLLWLQIRTFREIPMQKEYANNIRHFLENNVKFYREKYFRSIFIASLSNPLILISGSLLFFYFKYGEVRPLQAEDYLVFTLFCIAGFVGSVYVQLRQFNFQIRQIEECLSELDENGIYELTLKKQNYQRRRMSLIFIIALVAGLILFVFILII